MATVDTAEIILRLEALEFERRMRRARSFFAREIDGMRRMARVTLDVASNAAKITLGGGALIGGVGATIAVKKAADLEYAIAKIRKTTGLTGASLGAFTDQIKALATSMPGVSVESLLQIAEMGGRLGIAADGLMDYVKAVASITIALDDIPAEEAAGSLARIAFNFKLPTSAALGLASALNKLDDTSTATGRDILDVANRISGAGATMGLTAQEVFALAAVLKDAGVTNEVAGTAVSGILLKMGKDTKAFAEVAGKSIEEFERLMREDALTALQLVSDKLGSLDAISGIRALDDLEIDGVRAADTFLKLSKNFDSVRERIKVANQEFKTGASIMREVSTMGQTFWAQWERLTNQFGLSAAALGERFLPALKALADHIGAAFDRLRDIFDKSDFFKRLQSIATQVADAFGGMLERPQTFVEVFGAAVDILVAKLGELLAKFKVMALEIADTLSFWGVDPKLIETTKAEVEDAKENTQRRVNALEGHLIAARVRGEESRQKRAAERAAPMVRDMLGRMAPGQAGAIGGLAGRLFGGPIGRTVAGGIEVAEKARAEAREDQARRAAAGAAGKQAKADAKAEAERIGERDAARDAEFRKRVTRAPILDVEEFSRRVANQPSLRGSGGEKALKAEESRLRALGLDEQEFRKQLAAYRTRVGPGAQSLGPEAARAAGIRPGIGPSPLDLAQRQLLSERMQERAQQMALRATETRTMDPDEFARAIDEGPNRALELATEQRDFMRDLLQEVRQLRTEPIEVQMDDKPT